VNEVHLVDNPPNQETIRKLWEASGQELKKLFNTSGQKYRELGLKEKLEKASDEEKLQLLASDGMLIKRPIVTDGKEVSIGFKEEMFAEVWGK
jgi:arsenate reductase